MDDLCALETFGILSNGVFVVCEIPLYMDVFTCIFINYQLGLRRIYKLQESWYVK